MQLTIISSTTKISLYLVGAKKIWLPKKDTSFTYFEFENLNVSIQLFRKNGLPLN
jgi:hypothetical protein